MGLETKESINTEFAEHVKKGLRAPLKYLSSRFIYDEHGDKLFQEIMSLPEYYLTRTEFEILQEQKNAIADAFIGDGTPFTLIELGAGDGTKTRVLLKELIQKKAKFTYVPVDISKNVLEELEAKLSDEMPGLTVEPVNQEYFKALKFLSEHQAERKVVLFLGSNIGNFSNGQAQNFMSQARECCHEGDLWFLGIDMKKDPEIIRKAYNDSRGITARFNLNLLHRMNEELGANFEIKYWKHYESYDPISGEARSYLVSKIDQEVRIEEIDLVVSFEQGEPIHTEISKKYHLKEIEQLAQETAYKVETNFIDQNRYFVDTLWRIKS